MTTIVYVSDHALLSEAVCQALRPLAEVQIVEQSEQLLSCLRKGSVDLLLLNVEFDGGRRWAELLQLAQKRELKTILLGYQQQANVLRSCIVLGAYGYLERQCTPQQLLRAAQTVLGGAYLYPPETIMQVFRDQQEIIPLMHKREVAVLNELLADPDIENVEIAQRVSLSYGRVKNLLTELYAKFGVTRRHQLVNEARRRGYYPGMPVEQVHQYYARRGALRPALQRQTRRRKADCSA